MSHSVISSRCVRIVMLLTAECNGDMSLARVNQIWLLLEKLHYLPVGMVLS